MADNEAQLGRRPPKKDDCCVAKQEQLLDYDVTFCVDIEECKITNVTCVSE